MYLLKLALRPWRLNPFSQILSSVAVGMLLLSVGLVFWVDRGLRPVLDRLRTEQLLTVYLGDDLDKQDERKVADSIRVSMGAHAEQVGGEVPEVSLVAEDQLLRELKTRYPELGKELDDLGEEASSVLPRYISVKGRFEPSELSVIVSQIKALKGVDSIDTSEERARSSIEAFSAIQWIARALCVGLIFALTTALVHLSRTHFHSQQETLQMMSLWGADPVSLRVPTAFSGLMTGAIGGLIAAGLFTAGSGWFAGKLMELTPALSQLPRLSVFMIAGVLIVMGAMSGLVSGLIGSRSSGTGG